MRSDWQSRGYLAFKIEPMMSLPDDVVESLKSHLGRARSAVKQAKSDADETAIRAARDRVQLAKTGLGERGPYWWVVDVADRLAQARDALRQLDG